MTEDRALIEAILQEEADRDLPKLWERQPYENDNAYGAFRYYANLSPVERTLLTAYKAFRKATDKPITRSTKAPPTWLQWFRGVDGKGVPIPDVIPWPIRARAEDQFKEDAIRRVQIERQAILRNREWEAAEKLFRRADDMLKVPLLRTEVVNKQTIIEPTNWDETDITRAYATASKLARMATDMPATSVKLDWRKEMKSQGVDPENVFERIVREIEKQFAMADTSTD